MPDSPLMTFFMIFVPALLAGNFVLTLLLFTRPQDGEKSAALRSELLEELRATRQEISQAVQNNMAALGTGLADSQKAGLSAQSRSITQLNEQFTSHMRRTDAKLEAIADLLEKRLTALQADSNRQLDEMRQTVGEKLQTMLTDRLTQSFSQVSERLEQVHRGLGEMQQLAAGVGDLKKILSNVKTRGILGEIQLGAILEQLLAPEQYAVNVKTNPTGNDRVEFAILLPGEGSAPVWLPIDAKFPADLYAALCDAYDAADKDAVDAAGRALEQRIRTEAKSIREKYVSPPSTTDFAVMFLPVEGLYAEVVRRGLVETLQRDFRVTVAGPTTMAALLNALQTGFRTLAIQKRSSEVWELLGAVKTEFVRFSDILKKARDRLRLADEDLDRLIGTRTRAIERRLRAVTELPEHEAMRLIGEGETADDDALPPA